MMDLEQLTQKERVILNNDRLGTVKDAVYLGFERGMYAFITRSENNSIEKVEVGHDQYTMNKLDDYYHVHFEKSVDCKYNLNLINPNEKNNLLLAWFAKMNEYDSLLTEKGILK